MRLLHKLAGAAAAAVLACSGAAHPASAQPRLPDTALEPADYIPAGNYIIASLVTYECMALLGLNNIEMNDCSTGGLVWTLEYVGTDDEFYIRQGPLCLSDLPHQEDDNDASALPCAFAPDQHWRFEATPGVGFKIRAYDDHVASIEPPLDYEDANYIRVRPEQGNATEYWGLFPA